MKRVVFSAVVLASVFGLGFLTARSPFLNRAPSAEAIAKLEDQKHQEIRRQENLRTTEFLRMEVIKAEEEYIKTRNPQFRLVMENLKEKLEMAESHQND